MPLNRPLPVGPWNGEVAWRAAVVDLPGLELRIAGKRTFNG